MQQLNEFCGKYIPQYFAMKYNEGNAERKFFDYEEKNNVFELTAKIFNLVDQLHVTNPQLQPTKIVDTYFMFRFSDFSATCKENKLRDEDNKNTMKEAIRKILKKMEDHHRESFQIFIRLIYMYFDSKEKQFSIDSKKQENRTQYESSLPALYEDLRLKTEINCISFVPSQFMKYAIDLLLDMKPNKKFINIIQDLTKKCEFPEIIQEKIFKNIQAKKNMNLDSCKDKFESTEISQSGSKSNPNSQTKIESNEETPVKEKSPEKAEMKTLQTSQKKYNMIFKNPQQDRNTLDSLKTSLMLQRKSSNTYKERTIYNCTKYVVSKKTLLGTPSVMTSASRMNQIQEMRFSELNRGFTSRFLDVPQYQDEEFLLGATPKPKKKIKTESGLIGPRFDSNGNYIHKN